MGRNANARDWVMGQTIVITVGEADAVGEISVYPGAVYIVPTESGGWSLFDGGVYDPAETFGDLESAARAAHERVARQEVARRKP
jgi:hypothetical protein